MTGPFNAAASINISSEAAINWLPERMGVSVNDQGTDVTDKNVRCALIRTPGLKLHATLPKVPVRGVFPGAFRLFAASGDSWYEVFNDGTFVDRSIPGFTGASGLGSPPVTIGNDGRPVQCFFNGNQALIISAGKAYCDSGNGPVLCQFSDPLYDLLVDPTDSSGKTLTTPVGGAFDASDIGKTIEITGGAGFQVGLKQKILSVNSFGGAVGASFWGMSGSGLGTGIIWLGGIDYTDLILVTPTQIHSPSRVFGPAEIGTDLTLTGGGGFTAGTYTITGLVFGADGNPTGDAILDRAAGTAGSTGGAGSLAFMPVTASQGAFLDGYYFVTPYPRTKTIYYSAINEGTFWSPLDFFQKSNYPDNVGALFSDHQELYTFGDLENSQVFRDVGELDNPFAPDPGANMHLGVQAEHSVVRLGNGVAWLGVDVRRGGRKAIHAEGYAPRVVSTPALEAEWAKYATVHDAVAYTEAIEGHECWVISFPSANVTWAYDATTGWWHQRGWWDGSAWDRSRVWVECVVALLGGGGTEKHYGGDWENGKIYTVSQTWKTDDGNPIVRRRVAPHLTLENMRRFYARFEIDCDVLGLQRVFWNRLGNGRDRVWKIDAIQSSESGGVTLTLGWSDDRGQGWQHMFTQSLAPSVDVRLANAYLNYVDAGWH